MQEALKNAFEGGIIEVGPNKRLAIVSGKKILFHPFLGGYFPYDTIVLMRRMNALPSSDLNFALFTSSNAVAVCCDRVRLLPQINKFLDTTPTHRLMFKTFKLTLQSTEQSSGRLRDTGIDFMKKYLTARSMYCAGVCAIVICKQTLVEVLPESLTVNPLTKGRS